MTTTRRNRLILRKMFVELGPNVIFLPSRQPLAIATLGAEHGLVGAFL